MNKEDFKSALIVEIQKIPISERKNWNATDLFVWWTQVSNQNPYLRWDWCKGDLWQRIPGFLKGYYGNTAIL